MMKFSEAMKAVEEGKRVRCVNWVPGQFLMKFITGEFGGKIPNESLTYRMDEEWELYEEPKKLLSFAEIIAGLKVDKKFKRSFWKNYFLQISICGNLIIFSSTGKTEQWVPQFEDFEKNDWIEVK